MARLAIGDQAWEIAPFRLRELRRAAPFIDRIAARAKVGGLETVAAVAESAADMLGVLAAGLPEVEAAVLEGVLSLSDLEGLRATFEHVLQEAGLTRAGEPPAGPPPAPFATQLDALLAELVAGGCGDWDVIEAGWSLHRCHALRRYWREVAPPAHVSLAALAGFRAAREERIDDPAELDRQLRQMGLLS